MALRADGGFPRLTRRGGKGGGGAGFGKARYARFKAIDKIEIGLVVH